VRPVLGFFRIRTSQVLALCRAGPLSVSYAPYFSSRSLGIAGFPSSQVRKKPRTGRETDSACGAEATQRGTCVRVRATVGYTADIIIYCCIIVITDRNCFRIEATTDVLDTALADFDPLAIGRVAVVDQPPSAPETGLIANTPARIPDSGLPSPYGFDTLPQLPSRVNDTIHKQRSDRLTVSAVRPKRVNRDRDTARMPLF
jgi:hypothetical protein